MANRRPNPIAWAILGGIVLLLVLVLRACGGGDPYAERAIALAAESAALGNEVAALPTRIEDLDREELFRDLRSWQQAADGHLATAEDLVPARDRRIAHGYFVAALGFRAEALKRYEPAVRNALSDGDAQVAVSQLTGVMQDLAFADRAYDLFRGAWPEGGRRPPEGPWVPQPEAATSEGVRVFVGVLREQPALEEIYNLSVASVSVTPRPTGREEDLDILPFTRALQVTVVVENTGNQAVPAAPVSAVLTSETDPRPQSAEGRVGALQPGGRASVTLNGLAPTPGGPINLLRVSVGPVAGEVNLLDNTFEYKFAMRRP